MQLLVSNVVSHLVKLMLKLFKFFNLQLFWLLRLKHQLQVTLEYVPLDVELFTLQVDLHLRVQNLCLIQFLLDLIFSRQVLK